jgi:hypothetical protein
MTTRHEGAWGERKYSSNSFLTSALERGECSASRPGRALAPGKGPPVPIVQESGWAPEPVWTQRIEEKILSPLPGMEPRSPGRLARSHTLGSLLCFRELPFQINVLCASHSKFKLVLPYCKVRLFSQDIRVPN